MSEQLAWVPVEADFQQALAQAEFLVYYQPIVELATGRLAAVEALVRWQHPVQGHLNAGRFMEVAETSGFSLALSEAVLRSACAQARSWELAGLHVPTVSLNPAYSQFLPGYLKDFLRSVLDETGVDPQRIALELHGDYFVNPAISELVLEELSHLGIPLWLDDYGIGDSALRYLTRFPFEVLKIDGEFVVQMADDPRWARVVCGMLGLARHLGLRSVAEAVNSDAELAMLRGWHCDLIQGWRYSQPVSAVEITKMLQDARRFE